MATIGSQQLSVLGPFAKNYQWSLDLGGVGIYAESATPPKYQGENIDVMLRGAYSKQLGIYKPQPCQITFLEPTSGVVTRFLHDWLLQCYDPKTGCSSANAGKMVILKLENCGGSIVTWTMHDAIIDSEEPEQLVSDGGQLWKTGCTIVCSYFDVS